jgi:RHS repeat-associated protein
MDENGTQTWTLYDPATSEPIMDFNASGSLETRYLWGPTGIVARESSGGTVAWYLADALGTVRDVINTSGTVIDHVDYSAFGTVLDESDPANGDRFVGFAGLDRDTVTGLNLAVEREENPGTARWDSLDPLGFAAGDANLYGYARDAPAAGVDPTGLDDAGINGGTVKLLPGVVLPPGTEILPENEKLGWRPFDPKKIPGNVDAIVLPGRKGGLLKIPDHTDVTISGIGRDGCPIYKAEYRRRLTWWPEWYPYPTPNPFRKPIPGAPPPPPPPPHPWGTFWP